MPILLIWSILYKLVLGLRIIPVPSAMYSHGILYFFAEHILSLQLSFIVGDYCRESVSDS